VLKQFIKSLPQDLYTLFDDGVKTESFKWFDKLMAETTIVIDVIDDMTSRTFVFKEAQCIVIGYVTDSHYATAIAVLGCTMAMAVEPRNSEVLSKLLKFYNEGTNSIAYTTVNMLKTVVENI